MAIEDDAPDVTEMYIRRPQTVPCATTGLIKVLYGGKLHPLVTGQGPPSAKRMQTGYMDV